MLFLFLFLLCNIKGSECFSSCGCIELPGNFSDGAVGSTVELVPEVGPQIGTLVPKPGPLIQIIDPLSRTSPTPSSDNCTHECTVLGCDWFTVQDGVCICGHTASIINCEEEIGPVLDVFCIHKAVEMSSSDKRRSDLGPSQDLIISGWFPSTATGPETTSTPDNQGNQASSFQDKQIDDHSFNSGNKNSSWYLYQYLKLGQSLVRENTTEVHYVGDKDSSNTNKILAVILGISALICLFLAGIRVYFQMRRIKAKEKKSMCNLEDASSTTANNIITRL